MGQYVTIIGKCGIPSGERLHFAMERSTIFHCFLLVHQRAICFSRWSFPFLPFPTDADPHLHVQPTLQQLFRDGTEVLRNMPREMVGKLHKCGKAMKKRHERKTQNAIECQNLGVRQPQRKFESKKGGGSSLKRPLSLQQLEGWIVLHPELSQNQPPISDSQ